MRQLEYNLKENEVIIIESLLIDYFNGLIPEQINPFIKNNNYDSVLPAKTLPYDNEVNLNELEKFNSDVEHEKKIESIVSKSTEKVDILEQLKELEKPSSIDSEGTVEVEVKPVKHRPVKTPAPVILDDCKIKQLAKITSEEWRKCFPSNYKEIGYDKTHTCGFQLIIDIIQHFKQINLTIQQIRDELLIEYQKYLSKYKDIIIDILILEGKYKLGRKIKFVESTFTFTDFIQAPEYVISNLDLWIMMEKYNIPTILVSPKTILQTEDTKKIFTLVPNKDLDTYIFVVTSAHLTKDSILKYNLIQTNTRNMEISLSAITNEQCLRTISESIGNWLNIKDYLKKYIIIPNRGNIVKKLNPAINFEIEEGSDSDDSLII